MREKGEWVEESVLMNEITIRVSVKFTARERSLQRPVSKKASGVFGVSIDATAKLVKMYFVLEFFVIYSIDIIIQQ